MLEEKNPGGNVKGYQLLGRKGKKGKRGLLQPGKKKTNPHKRGMKRFFNRIETKRKDALLCEGNKF